MKHNKAGREVYSAFVMVIQFSLYMLVPILALTFFGVWLGNKLNIDWMAIPFFFIGALSGGRSIYVMAKKISASGKKSKKTLSINDVYNSQMREKQIHNNKGEDENA